MKKLAYASLVLLGLATLPAQAVTVYSTDFSAISSAVGGTPQGDGSIWGVGSFATGTPSATWSASVGNFDYLKNGNSGYTCVGNAGGCIELGGSTGFGPGGSTPPSTIDISLNLAAGSYTVAFDYARQQFASGFDLKINSSTVASFPVTPAAASWNSFSQAFTVAATGLVTFSFVTGALPTHVGSQIDNFSVTAVPEPETYAMMLAGLLAVGFMLRRRSNS